MCMVIAAFRPARTTFPLSQLCSCNNGNGCDAAAAAAAAAAQWSPMHPLRMHGPVLSCLVTIAPTTLPRLQCPRRNVPSKDSSLKHHVFEKKRS